MRSLLMVAAANATETIVIQDNNGKDSLTIWALGMLVMFILYMIVMLIHDIRREEKLERVRQEREAQKEAELINDIDI